MSDTMFDISNELIGSIVVGALLDMGYKFRYSHHYSLIRGTISDKPWVIVLDTNGWLRLSTSKSKRKLKLRKLTKMYSEYLRKKKQELSNDF